MLAYKIHTKQAVQAQIDPLASLVEGKEIYLLPAGCTWLEPLPDKEGFEVKFDGENWVYEAISEPEPEPEPYVPIAADPKQQEIYELKGKLSDSDYAIIKIAEGAATKEEYAELIIQRQVWRARINELEA